MRVLVTETIAAAGIERLREAAEVDVETELERAELLRADRRLRRAVVRSATQRRRRADRAPGRGCA